MKFDKVYDICFPLGQVCMASMALRKTELQFASYPFDWAGGLESLLPYAELVVSDFKDFLNREDFVYNGTNPINGLGKFFNKRTNFQHPHDLIDKPEIDDEMYRGLVDKYARRISRFKSQLSSAKHALMVSVCNVTHPRVNAEEMIATRATLMKKFPGLDLDYIVFQYDTEYTMEKPLITEIGEGVIEVRFEYKKTENGIVGADYKKLIPILQQFKIKVVDPRTREEIAEYKLKKTLKKYAKYGAKSYLGYVIKRNIAKMKKSLKKLGFKVEVPCK